MVEEARGAHPRALLPEGNVGVTSIAAEREMKRVWSGDEMMKRKKGGGEKNVGRASVQQR